MPNNLGKLITGQRIKLGLQQKQVAKMIGITNVSLCKVQTGERKISKKKLKMLSDVLQIDYTTILEYAGYDVDFEIKCAKHRINQQADENLILLLDDLAYDDENTKILKEIIAILNKSNKEDKANIKKMLHVLKIGLYNADTN